MDSNSKSSRTANSSTFPSRQICDLWSLEESCKILYDGIDSITVTERNADPSGAMGAIQRSMANDIACLNVGWDFHRPATERILFAGIEASVVPGGAESNQKIRETIVILDDKLRGCQRLPDHSEVERTTGSQRVTH